jgi:hypothetical protein
LPRPARTLIFLSYASHHHWNNRHVPPHTAFFHRDGVLRIFFFLKPGLTWNCDPPNLSLPCSLGWQMCAVVPSCWLRWSVANFLPRLASNHSPPDLSLPNG